MTKRTAESLGSLHPQFRAVATAFVAECQEQLRYLSGFGPQVRVEVISGLRSWHTQAALYAQGRTKPGKIVTKARPGSSWHNYGLAFDLGLFQGGIYLDEGFPAQADKHYAELGKLAPKYGLEWAGNWKSFPETPHFQKTYGHSLAELQAQMKANGYQAHKLKLKPALQP